VIEVALSPTRIPVGAAADLEVRLTNSDREMCLNVVFVIRLPTGIRCLRGPDRIRKPKLHPGESITALLRIRADRAGSYQLTSPSFSYTDHMGRAHHDNDFAAEITADPALVPARVPKTPEPKTPEPKTAAPPAAASPSSHQAPGSRSKQTPRSLVKILFLGANPPRTESLRIDQEIREIQQTIREGKERDRIKVQTEWAVRPSDITRALMDFRPHFVHFAGHGGGEEGSFTAENERGFAHLIPVAGLVQAFRAAGPQVQCVIVNACETERLARALTAVVPRVIGMRQPVGDSSAIRFSIGFYQALAAGEPVETAFEVGKALLMMTPREDDAQAPLLLYGPERTAG
jgi:CHAT domain-containing protein